MILDRNKLLCVEDSTVNYSQYPQHWWHHRLFSARWYWHSLLCTKPQLYKVIVNEGTLICHLNNNSLPCRDRAFICTTTILHMVLMNFKYFNIWYQIQDSFWSHIIYWTFYCYIRMLISLPWINCTFLWPRNLFSVTKQTLITRINKTISLYWRNVAL